MTAVGRAVRVRRLALVASLPPLLWAVGVVPVPAATLVLPPDAGALPGASTVVPLTIDLADGLLGTGIVIRYDPAVALATAVNRTTLSSSQSLTVNLQNPGEIRISLFGVTPLQGGGELLTISFNSVGAFGTRTVLDLVSASLNEGAIPVLLRDGHYCVQALPAEVGEISVALEPEAGEGAASIGWSISPTAERYNLYRGTRGDLTDLGCFAAGLPSPPAFDREVPPPDGLFVYLVSSANCRGESGLGTDSEGRPRLPASRCP